MSQPENKQKRLQKIDIFRGLALIGMVIYHFCWDLSYFSYISPTIPAEGSLRILARIVAFSFLFTTGFCIALAHGKGIRWRSFCKRIILIMLAAILVSVVSYIIMPQGLIYFGILHEIVVTSIVALLFLHTPIFINILVILFVLFLPYFYQSAVFDQMALSWLGLSQNPPPSFDFVPVFPWFSASLAGLTTARLFAFYNAYYTLVTGIKPRWLDASLQWMGRHSLFFYLVHQPILLAIVFCVSLVVPPSTNNLRAPMEQACIDECRENADKSLCTAFCGCVFDRIEAQNLIPDFSRGEISQTDERLQIPINVCWNKTILETQNENNQSNNKKP